VEPVTVDLLTSSLNVAVIVESMPIQVEPLDGDVEMTLGGVVSGATAVVKVQVRGAAIAFPARSFTPVVTVAVWVVRPANKADGWNVALSPSIVTVPTTDLPLLSASEKVSGVMVVAIHRLAELCVD